MRRFYILILIVIIFIFFLLLNLYYSNYIEYNVIPNYIKGTEGDQIIEEIQHVLQQQRKMIEKDMNNYTYYAGNSSRKNYNLDNFLMEKGGTPVRSIIVTSWRSGSTFLAGIINAHPANFYHVEPLVEFGYIKIREETFAKKALQILESMLKCNFSNMEHYLEYGHKHNWIFDQNSRLWEQCLKHPTICRDPRYLSLFCQLFPFNSMKVVRLRLHFIEQLLAQESLGVRVVYLVRDPRGILQSRKHNLWCQGKPDCTDPNLLCSDLISDFKAAIKFSKKYPRNFRVVRYEDLSVNPYEYSKDLYRFYGLNFHPSTIQYLNTHTKINLGDQFSTFRNSKEAPFHWRLDLTFPEVQKIQKACSVAFQLWGYVQAQNLTHQHYFNPSTNFSLKYPDNFDTF